jgi:hypothetical protein
MEKTHRLWFACLGVLAGACTGGHDDPETLGGYAVEMQVAIDAIQAELAAHHDGMHEAATEDALEQFEWQHMEGVAAGMDRLERAHQGVTMCGQHMERVHEHTGLPPLMAQNEAIASLAGEAYREIGRHSYAVDTAQTIEAAIAEEGEHARIMDELLDRMGAHCEGMMIALDDMGDGATMRCPEYARVPAR